MKAATALREYLFTLQDSSNLEAIRELDEILASRARNAKRARAEHKAAESLLADVVQAQAASAASERLLADNISIYAQALNLPATATAQDVLEGIRSEQAAVESAREQRTEQTEEISRRFHDYRQDVDDFMKKLCRALTLPLLSTSGDVLQEVERLRAVLLTQQETTEKEFLRAQEAERQYRELRAALRQLVMDFLHPSFKDSSSGEQISELRSLIQILQQPRDAAPESKGVRAIAEARAYQQRAHPAPTNSQTHRHMLQSALALLMQQPELYPFGDSSWNGIRRRDGRAGQLAHAGACIAALIDMLPAQQTATQKDHAAFPNQHAESWLQ